MQNDKNLPITVDNGYTDFDAMLLQGVNRSHDWLGDGLSVYARRIVRGTARNTAMASEIGVVRGSDFGDCEYNRLGFRGVGNYGEFAKNIGPEVGKLSTILRYGMSSRLAYARYRYRNTGEEFFGVVDGPRRWTGGVMLQMTYITKVSCLLFVRTLACAFSGDHGVMDEEGASEALESAHVDWNLFMQVEDSSGTLERCAKVAWS